MDPKWLYRTDELPDYATSIDKTKSAPNWKKPPKEIPADKVVREYAADAVIIGAGHAGTCAARAAAESGASVIVLEQQEKEKYRALGSGFIGHINSSFVLERGAPKVDVDEFVLDWQLRGNNRSNYRLVKKYAENSGECFDWFIGPMSDEEKKEYEARFLPVHKNFPKAISGIKTFPSCGHVGFPMKKILMKNQSIAEENGARFYFGVKGVQLEKKQGAVVAVLGEDGEGGYIRFKANKGVILAAGDFSGNPDMCRELLPEVADLLEPETQIRGLGWDGSGIRMGMWAGGRLEPRSLASMGGNFSIPGMNMIGSTPTLWVNKHGKRYTNEGFGNVELSGIAGAKQPNGKLWSIFDSDIFELMTHCGCEHMAFYHQDEGTAARLRDNMKRARGTGAEGLDVSMQSGCAAMKRLYCGETIEELAGYMFEEDGDRNNFINSVQRYNALARNGRDEDFGKEPFLLRELKNGPFYAFGLIKSAEKTYFHESLGVLVTLGGLMTDEDQNVLGEDFEPIPGLYATGNCCGGRFGLQYSTPVSGSSLGIAETLGREVGKTVARL